MANRLDVSDQTAISMPMRNLLSIIAAVAVGVWAYFGVLERITMLETKAQLSEKDLKQAVEMLTTDLEKNTEFRMMNNGVNIKRLQEDVKILRDDVEKLKDSNRDIIYKNGQGQ